MTSQHLPVRRIKTTLVATASALALIALASAVALTGSSREAAAKAEFTTQTKLPCGQCHTTPSGGGKLTSFGTKFKANGYKVK
jgi:hypothetical protein